MRAPPSDVPSGAESLPVREASQPTPRSALGESGVRLGRIGGVRILLDWSLLIVFGLVLFNLGAGIFPRWHPDWSLLTIWATAFGAAVLFFASVLAHELSHALVARTQGVNVSSITLFLFGGVAHMESEPRTPKAELWIAIVGPITSLLIGVGAIVAGGAIAQDALLMAGEDPSAPAVREAMGQVSPLATLLLWLGPVNVLLAVFNTVPGFPLDGGRVLRALLWWATDDIVKATRWASFVGSVVAWLLIALGVMNAFSGMFIQGLWLVLIGWFLHGAARASYQSLLTRRGLENVPVSQVMWRGPSRVAPSLSLDQFVQDHLMGSDQKAFPVESPDGRMLGLITLHDVRGIPREQWPTRTVESVMTPASALSSLSPNADAEAALDVLAQYGVDQVPVVEGGHLEGLVRRSDLVKWISLQRHAQH